MRLMKYITAAWMFIFLAGYTQSEAKASQLLKEGSAGSEVTFVQDFMKKLGYFETETTGYYGPVTAQAICEFQRDFGLRVDGVTGTETANMIYHVDTMAHIVNGEARGESYEGQVAVAAVILNRMESNEFPDAINQVIYQRNAFTAINDGQYRLLPGNTAYQAVKDAFLGWDPTGGAVYYYNPNLVTDQWIFTRTVIKRIGNHTFAY
ncbi:cell wall hydrolase [Cytobacillus sp. NCCP-133]|uniref:cell wall hydrolase n=1 Tax=Cytobacillus sp. NCCP-133 TaxID=766848 RepID=UPI00223000DE|nr:cell wall hydrolase [Cytobacillus sp. NCCP-133]GLB60237.1 spore cortex-lytic enzyme [Cytobacillus sp. NCCP-133]